MITPPLPARPVLPPATILLPMRPDRFPAFVEVSVAGYADDNVRALRWAAATAAERSRAEFDRLLPQGASTPGHFLDEIVDGVGGETVGYLWFAVNEDLGARSAFVFSLRILPAFRGRGHARAAMALLEDEVAGLGAEAIGLHVFGFNTGAQALYRSLGYGITGFNMIKRLPAPTVR